MKPKKRSSRGKEKVEAGEVLRICDIRLGRKERVLAKI